MTDKPLTIPEPNKIPMIQNGRDYSSIKKWGKEMQKAWREVGGTAHAPFADEMIMQTEYKDPFGQARCAVAQVEGLEDALRLNKYLMRRGQFFLRWIKVLRWFVPSFLGGELIDAYVEFVVPQRERTFYQLQKEYNRAEHYHKQFGEIIEKTGSLTEERMEKESVQSEIMACFSKALAHLYSQGNTSPGLYLVWDTIGRGTYYEFREELMKFAFEEKEDGRLVYVTRRGNSQQRFLEDVGRRWSKKPRVQHGYRTN